MTLIGYTCHEEKWDSSGFGNLHQALKSEDEAAFCITFDWKWGGGVVNSINLIKIYSGI